MAIDIAFKADIDLGEGAKSLKSLKQEFKEAQKELDGLTVGSDKYIASLKRLGAIKDDIGDLNDQINAFKPENKMAGFSAVIGGVASGFQMATGAMAIFGGENKELEKQLLKVQAVMAFTEGIKGVLAMGDSFTLLKNSLMSTAIGQKILTAAQWLWNAAMAANPIGLVIAGVAALVGGVLLLAKAMTGSISTVEKLGKQYDLLKESIEQNNKVHESEIALLSAVKGHELEIYEIRKKQIQANIQLAKLALQKALLEFQQASQTSFLNSLLLGQDGERARVLVKQMEAQKEVKKAQDEMIISVNALGALEATEHNRKIDNIKTVTAATIKSNEDRNKSEQDRIKESGNAWLAEIALKAENEAREEANAAEKAKAEEIIEADRIKASGNEWLAEIAQRDLEDADAENRRQQNAERDKQIDADQRASRDGQLNAAMASNAALQNLSDVYFLFKRNNLRKGSAEELKAAKQQFKINKALSIASATIQGIQAVIAAYSSGAAVPIAGIVLGPAMAVIAGISAAANIAKIAASKFEGGGGGGASVGGGSIPTISAPATGSAPTINAPSQATTSLNPDGTVRGAVATPDVRVTVLETDISRTQTRVNVMESSSRL